MKKIEFTKEQFRKLLDENKVDLRANNIVYYEDEKYEIKTIDAENKVLFMRIDEWKKIF